MITVLVLLISFIIKAMMYSFGLEDFFTSIVDVLIICVISICIYHDIRSNKKTAYATYSIFLGYLMRLFFLFFDLYGRNIFVLPNSGADSEMFYSNSVNYVTTHYTKRGYFPLVMGNVFSVIGTSRIFAQFLLLLCSIVSITLLAYVLSYCTIDMRIKKNVVLLTSLLPNFAVLSSIFLRESIVTMLLTISIVFFIRWFYEGKNYLLFMAFFIVFLAMIFHSGSISVGIGYISVLLLYDRKKKKYNFNPRAVIPASIFVFIIVFLFINYSDSLFGKMQNIDSIDDIANTREAGGSSYAKYVGNSNNPLNLIIFTIPRILYFMISPFPWQWRGLGDIIMFFSSSIFYLIVFYSLLRYLKNNKNNKEKPFTCQLIVSLVIVSFITAFVFAWGTSNTGTAVRHREKMIIVWSIIWALTKSISNNESKSLR